MPLTAKQIENIETAIKESLRKKLRQSPDSQVTSGIAIPYNPYAPEPYERWTSKGMLDFSQELKVAEGLWNFLGGGEVYEELLNCFERAGIELKDEIDNYFSTFN